MNTNVKLIKNDDKQEEFPRDYDLNFTDPHGDVDDKQQEKEQG